MNARRLVVVGSQAFTVDAIEYSLQHASGLNIWAVVDTGADIRGEIRRAEPDIVVLDGITNLDRAFELLDQIAADGRDALVVIAVADVTASASVRALEAGAVLFAWSPGTSSRASPPRREFEALARAARATRVAAGTAGGGATLTSRELEILRFVADGYTNAWIARKLWVTEQTVKFHLGNAYRKMGVANRTEATRFAIRHGLVSRRDGEDAGSGGTVTRPDAETPARSE